MIIKTRLGSWRFTFSMAPVVDVVGVNSRLPDGQHFLMWDFDDVHRISVIDSLESVQNWFELPNIYILETLRNRNYIAYCLKRFPWENVLRILASTPFMDLNFFKYGVYRERFTLRVSSKCGRTPKLSCVLHSKVPEDVKPKDMMSWVKYETLGDNYQSSMHKLGPLA